MSCKLQGLSYYWSFFLAISVNICLGNSPEYNENRIFIVNGFNGEQSLGKYLDIYEDPGSLMTFEEVLSLENEAWTASKTFNPNMGYSSSTYWFRLVIQFDEKAISNGQSYLLEIGNPRLDTLDYYEEKDGVYNRKELGSTKPFSVREVEYIHPVVKLNPSNKRMTYYFKVNSVLTVVVPVILINEETLNNRRANEGLFYGIYFGVLLIMTFYNLVIFIRTREKAFLYYVLYISFFMLANFSLLGYSFQYFWPDNTFWAQRCTLFFFSMSTGAALQFGRKFLDLKNHQPVADLIARWSFRFIFLYGVLYIFFYTVFFSYFSSLLTLFTCIFLLYTGIFAVIKRYRPAYYYLIAWTAFLIAIIILVLMSQGIIPTNSFTRNAIYFASALEAGLLSLALADRMNILAREKGIAQERLIELMQKDKEKEDLIDIVSHDLKGPINAINGLVNIMLMDKEKFSREDIGYLDHMNKISYRLLESVKRQLDLSALKNQNIRVHLEPLNISDQLKEILKNYEIDTRGKNMQIKTKISGENLMTLANREYLQHIFENLLSNAIKFSEQGKNIYINLSEVNDHIRTIITDEGPGISEVDREKMYKKFQKLSARPTAGESSSGLGLSIVKKYTDALGGHLDCVSEKGKGTSFIIELKKYTGL